jgi:hypothetical protein
VKTEALHEILNDTFKGKMNESCFFLSDFPVHRLCLLFILFLSLKTETNITYFKLRCKYIKIINTWCLIFDTDFETAGE